MKMPPRFALLDLSNIPGGYAITGSNILGPSGSKIDFAGCLIRKSSAPVRASLRLSALCNHVFRIVEGRAKKQMAGIDAGRNITSVADKHAERNWAVGVCPRKAMSERSLSGEVKFAVSRFEKSSAPNNAAVVIGRAIAVEYLPQSPVCGATKPFAVNNHDALPKAAVVRARDGVFGAVRARFSYATSSGGKAAC